MFEKKVFFLNLLLISITLSISHSGNAANWGSTIVSSFSDSSSSSGTYSSIAIDYNSNAHIVYRDGSGKLKYATNLSGQWKITTFESWGNVGYDSSITIDPSNKIHISYSDSLNWNLKYATNRSGKWITTTIDSLGSVGSDNSITIDSSGRIHISYSDDTNGNLKYAIQENGRWTIKTLDANGLTGLSSSIVTDSLDNVHISYVESRSIYENFQLQYKYHLKYITDLSGEWKITTVYSPSTLGEPTYEFPKIDTSIAVDKTNAAHIAYHQPELKDLFYATNNSGSWVVTKLVENGDTGFYPSICIDSSNKAHISYHDRTQGTLKYISNATGPWISETVDSSGTSGIHSSIVLDSSQEAHISYASSNSTSCFNCGGSHYLKYANNIVPFYQIGVGSWSYTTSKNWVAGHPNCLSEPDGTAKITLLRDGNNVSITVDDDIKMIGMLNYDQLNMSASFLEYPLPDRSLPEPNVTFLSDGLMNILVDLTATSNTFLSGTLSWTWVYDENLQCKGGSKITVSAINVSPPEINVGVIEPTGGVIETMKNNLPWLMLLMNTNK